MISARTTVLLTAAVAVISGAWACLECTAIGCIGGVALKVVDGSGAPADVRTATVTAPDGSRAVLTCGTSTQVGSSTVTGRFSPNFVDCTFESITITVEGVRFDWVEVELETDIGAKFAGTVSLSSEERFLNGPFCDDEPCWSGRATVTAQ